MTEPDYDKLIERINVRVDHDLGDDSPTTLRLLNEAANAIRVLRAENASLERANLMLIESNQRIADERDRRYTPYDSKGNFVP